MDFTIRSAKREDCPEMLELIRELAVFERAPNEVTVSLQPFEESGFGEKPVWYAYVACASEGGAAMATTEAEEKPAMTAQDPMITQLLQESEEHSEAQPAAVLKEEESPADSFGMESGIKLEEPVDPVLPEPVKEMMPLLQDAIRCEKVIGFALYYIRYSTWKGQRMYLEDILVTERWRGKGVGTALMDALIAAAAAEGLHGISWQVLEWNESAIQFYKRYNPRFDKEWINVAIDV
jgi:GNAT superfamily N-acetyltransferase